MTDVNVVVSPIVNTVTVQQQINEVTVTSIGVQGIPGRDGTPGQQGIPGVANPAYYSFTFEQQSNASIWTIPHNLGYKPGVAIIDYGGNNIEADITHIDSATLTLTLNPAASGFAYLS